MLGRRGRSLDQRAFEELIEESHDLHSDAIRVARQSIPDLQDLAADRRVSGDAADQAKLGEFTETRNALVGRLGMVLGGALGVGVISGAGSTVFLRRPSGSRWP